MKKLLVVIFALFTCAAHAQGLGNLPPNSVVGRLGAGVPGPAQAIPFSTLAAQLPIGGSGGGGTSAASITRTQIPNVNLTGATQITVNGYSTAYDRGYGATYTTNGANCSTGLEYIRDSAGNCFVLLVPPGGVQIGWFGAPGDHGNTTISSSDISANPQWRGTYTTGTTWDTVGAQEALYAAFAINSTPGSLVWNVNSGLLNYRYFVPKGQYGINRQLFTAMSGFTIEFESRESTLFSWTGAAGTKMWLFDSASYGLFINFSNQCGVAQSFTALTPCVSFDNDGASPGGLKTQQLTFINPFTVTAQNGQGIAINNVAGGSGQGDTITMINPYFGGDFASGQAALKVKGSNTMQLNILGGDCQGYVHNCVEIDGGTAFARGFHFENQNNNTDFVAPSLNQINTSGADFFAFGAPASAGPNVLEAARSEAEVLSDASGGSFTDVISSTNTTSEITGWSPSQEQLAGFMVHGGTKQRTFMVVDNGSIQSTGGCPGWCVITGGFGTTTLVDSNANYTPSALVGQNLWLREAGSVNGTNIDGIARACTISANTATSITSPCTVRTASTTIPGNTLTYQVGGNTGSGSPPSWDAATAGYKGNGSGGTQVVTTAGTNCVGFTNFGPPSVGDWLIIPHADKADPGGGNPVWDNAFYAKVTAVNLGSACASGTATTNSAVVNRNATVTTNLLANGGWVYGGTPLSLDGSITWINVNWSALNGSSLWGQSNITGSVTAPGSMIGFQSPNLSNNPTNPWFDNSITTALGPGSVPVINFVPGSTQTWVFGYGTTNGTIDTTAAINSANILTITPNGAVTFNGPAPTQFSQTVRFLIRSNGTNQIVTFGTNFASNGVVQTTAVSGTETAVTFTSTGNASQNWVEVSRSVVNGAGTNATVASPAGPNSTSAFKMQGLAGAITPQKSGNVNLQICGTIIESGITAAGSGIQYQLSYGTSTAPTSNAALTGTQVGTVQEYMLAQTVTAADVFVPFCQTAVVTGLTVGTAYWLDLAAEAVANTGFAFSKVNVAAHEF